MGMKTAIVFGAVAGGLLGAYSGAEAADVVRLAANSNSIEATPVLRAATNNIGEVGGNIIEKTFTFGGVALGALVAASTSLNLKYSPNENSNSQAEYSE